MFVSSLDRAPLTCLHYLERGFPDMLLISQDIALRVCDSECDSILAVGFDAFLVGSQGIALSLTFSLRIMSSSTRCNRSQDCQKKHKM